VEGGKFDVSAESHPPVDADAMLKVRFAPVLPTETSGTLVGLLPCAVVKERLVVLTVRLCA
jgi:hypothetical protein